MTHPSVDIESLVFAKNSASSGAGLYLLDSDAEIVHSAFLANDAPVRCINYSYYDSVGYLVFDTLCNEGGKGGAVFGAQSTTRMEHSILRNNSADDSGGGLLAEDSFTGLEQTAMVGNVSYGYVTYFSKGSGTYYLSDSEAYGGFEGGAALGGGTFEARNLLVVANVGTEGEGLSLIEADGTFRSIVVAGNRVYGSSDYHSWYASWDMYGGGESCTGLAGSGAGIAARQAAFSMSNAVLTSNLSRRTGYSSCDTYTGECEEHYLTGLGGGLALDSSEIGVEGIAVVGNWAESVGYVGGDMYSGRGGGIYFDESQSSLSMTSSILAYNRGYNAYSVNSVQNLTLLNSDIYNPGGLELYNLPHPDASNISVEPGFLEYLDEITPTNFHLSSASPLVDQGSGSPDIDGSSADLGCYGGPDGDGWDIDADGYPDYFWPGTLEQAPAGFSSSSYDSDDRNPRAQH